MTTYEFLGELLTGPILFFCMYLILPVNWFKTYIIFGLIYMIGTGIQYFTLSKIQDMVPKNDIEKKIKEKSLKMKKYLEIKSTSGKLLYITIFCFGFFNIPLQIIAIYTIRRYKGGSK